LPEEFTSGSHHTREKGFVRKKREDLLRSLGCGEGWNCLKPSYEGSQKKSRDVKTPQGLTMWEKGNFPPEGKGKPKRKAKKVEPLGEQTDAENRFILTERYWAVKGERKLWTVDKNNQRRDRGGPKCLSQNRSSTWGKEKGGILNVGVKRKK